MKKALLCVLQIGLFVSPSWATPNTAIDFSKLSEAKQKLALLNGVDAFGEPLSSSQTGEQDQQDHPAPAEGLKGKSFDQLKTDFFSLYTSFRMTPNHRLIKELKKLAESRKEQVYSLEKKQDQLKEKIRNKKNGKAQNAQLSKELEEVEKTLRKLRVPALKLENLLRLRGEEVLSLDSNFRPGDYSKSNLAYLDLSAVHMGGRKKKMKLAKSDLFCAKLKGVDGYRGDHTSHIFAYVDFTRTNLSMADLRGTDFSLANFNLTTVTDGTLYNSRTIFPSPWWDRVGAFAVELDYQDRTYPTLGAKLSSYLTAAEKGMVMEEESKQNFITKIIDHIHRQKEKWYLLPAKRKQHALYLENMEKLLGQFSLVNAQNRENLAKSMKEIHMEADYENCLLLRKYRDEFRRREKELEYIAARQARQYNSSGRSGGNLGVLGVFFQAVEKAVNPIGRN